MNKFFLIFITFLLLSIFSFAQHTTTIKGIAHGTEGKTISVLSYSNQITYLEKEIARSTIDSNGKFLLKINTDDTIFVYLDIDFYKAALYIEPNKLYNIDIRAADYDIIYKINPFLADLKLDINIVKTNDTELNTLISEFDTLYNDFIINNINILLYRNQNNKTKIDSFNVKVKSIFKGIENKYFNSYVRYKIASLEQITQVMGRESLFKKYFSNQPVLYNNVEYMNFFNRFFKKYITDVSKSINKTDLDKTINQEADYFALLDTLGKDTLLINEVIREMAMLKCLNEILYSRNFDKKNILKILKDISVKSKFSQHKTIAKDIITDFTKFARGTKAPDFKLINQNNKEISLSDFKGKFVYLCFWRTGCISCLDEMELIKKFNEKYGDKIEFISISADKEYMTMYNYVKDKGYDWNILYFEKKWDMLKSYGVKAFPLFVLIDILKYAIDKPSQNIEGLFIQLTQQPIKKHHKIGVK